MALYKFKLPDIGEGIAEAEIVAWHVKVGDMIGEDQQLADMMTDKATVEMESPVAGKVVELAGEVGDQIPIGSVLAVIETEGADRAEEPQPPTARTSARWPMARSRRRRRWRKKFRSLAADDDAAASRRRPEPQAPAPKVEPDVAARETRMAPRCSPPPPSASAPATSASTLAQVKTAGDRIRHADLDAYLLYNGGSVSAAARRRAPTKRSRSSAFAARSPRTCRRRSAGSRISRWSRNSTSPRLRKRGR